MTPLNLQLLSRVFAQPWAIRPEAFAAFAHLIASAEIPERERGEERPLKAEAGYVPLNDESWMATKRGTLPELGASDVTVLLVWGVLGRAWTDSDRWWLDAIEVDDLISAIAATPQGSTVVLWFRSPGGIITGMPETAAALRAAGKNRNLIAFTDDLCASAAYWLASQCSSIVATPTAEVGSIGVYIALYDFCEMLTQRGIKLELFRAGDMKGLGLMGKPLSDKDRAHLQSGVDESYRLFTKDVTNMRALDAAHMQGQTLNGKTAKEANLVDAFVPSAPAFFAALARGKFDSE